MTLAEQVREFLRECYLPNGALHCRWCSQAWTVVGHTDTCGYVEFNRKRDELAAALDARQAPAESPASHDDLLALVKEASEIMTITYAGNFPAGIESFLVRAAAAAALPSMPAEPPADVKETIKRLEALLQGPYSRHVPDMLRPGCNEHCGACTIERALSLLRQRRDGEGARDLCSACGGNGTLQLRNSAGQRVGVHICPRCKGDCWEATPPPADTAALLADGERLPALIEQRLRDALQDDDLEPWMYPQPGAEAIESLRSWIVAVVRASLTAGASPQETK